LLKNEIWFLACIDILESGHLGKGHSLALAGQAANI
jgi:hypothetical protein